MNLSTESIAACLSGPLAEQDLVGLLPALTDEIAKNGELAVVERCQVARANCGTAIFAVECVKRYYAVESASRIYSEMARLAMTPAERTNAQQASTDALFASMRTIGTAIPQIIGT